MSDNACFEDVTSAKLLNARHVSGEFDGGDQLHPSCNKSRTLRLVQVASEASCVILLWEAFSTCRPALNQFSKMMLSD